MAVLQVGDVVAAMDGLFPPSAAHMYFWLLGPKMTPWFPVYPAPTLGPSDQPGAEAYVGTAAPATASAPIPATAVSLFNRLNKCVFLSRQPTRDVWVGP